MESTERDIAPFWHEHGENLASIQALTPCAKFRQRFTIGVHAEYAPILSAHLESRGFLRPHKWHAIVEIGSPSTRKRDETIKRRLYERSGVAEYWVVDPDLDVVRVYRADDGRFGRPAELSLEASDVLTTPLLPDLEIHLSRVFG